jgi:hypothetical protein
VNASHEDAGRVTVNLEGFRSPSDLDGTADASFDGGMATRLAQGGLALLSAVCCGCQPPTEITVLITTSADCADVDDTAIVVGSSPEDVATRDPATVTSMCTGGRIGSIVLIPSGSREAALAVEVVTGVEVLAEDCLKGTVANVPGAATGCIYARRQLGFIPHTPLVLPIVMHRACIGVVCDPEQTCTETGACASATVVNPASCADPGGCDETTLGSAGGTGGGTSSSSHSSGSASSTSGAAGSSTSAASSGMGGAPAGPSSSSSSSSSGAGGPGPSSSSASSSASTTGMIGTTGVSTGASSSGMGGAPTGPSSSSSSGVVVPDGGLMTLEAGAI